jgi:hypothetical protein
MKKLSPNQLSESLKKQYELNDKIRGSYLARVTLIEGVISDIISQHFCTEKDKRELLLHLILGSSSFSFKNRIDALGHLMKLKYPILINEYPDLIKKLNTVRKFRNKISHSMLDTQIEFLEKNHEDRIKLDYFQSGTKKSIVITEKEWRRRIIETEGILFDLNNIQEMIIKMCSKIE